MKRLVMLLVFLLTIMTSVYASNVAVQINGKIIDFTDSNGAKVEAQIINDRTMVPFRKIFNELGVSDDNITFIGATRTVIAKKNDIEIKLQIDNKVAEKIVDGVSSKITLDTPPIISNDRTLVPLRFIAESLEKTVGWDGVNRTAIIIDYDYFMNQIKNKSNSLYNFLNKDSNNVKLSITRNYFDNEDASKNNTAIIAANINETNNAKNIIQNVTVEFSGTNELMKEIKTEGWNVIQYENVYSENMLVTKALNDGLKKVYGKEQLSYKYNELGFDGKYNNSSTELFKLLCNIDESKLNVTTFNSRKTEFDELLKLFKVSNSGTLTTGNIGTDNFRATYFDFTKFDNLLCDSVVNRTYNFLNSQFLKYDVNLEALCYDWPTANVTLTLNNSELIIDFTSTNEYNEKVQYIVKINKL